jgi:26S proteasome regulatory subunit N12
LLLTGEALETAALLCVKAKDDSAFERFFALLRPYYFDYELSESPRESLLIGLYLLYLLTEGRIGDFHTQLELIPHKRTHALIKFAIDLERDMHEGLYNRVWSACTAVPDKAFEHFANRLTDTVRIDIAKCLQASYESLLVKDAMKLLRFGANESSAFASFASHEDRNWVIVDETGISASAGAHVHFKASHDDDLDLGAEPLINQSLAYAHEIERII